MNINPKYQNGKIYTVRCRYDDTLIYVGSTIQKLCMRIAGHRRDKKCSLYQYVNGDWNNWYIELYEDYPCDNKNILEKREGEVIRLIGNINKQITGRTKKEYDKEYYEENRDKVLEKQKQYRQNNSDKIAERMKQYRENNSDKIAKKKKEQYEDNRDVILKQKKQYYKDNADKIAEINKEYYQTNREKVLERMKEKITCNKCGCEITKCHLKRHQRSKKCLNYNVANN